MHIMSAPDEKLGVAHLLPNFPPCTYSGRGNYMANRVLPRLASKGVFNIVLALRDEKSIPKRQLTDFGLVIRSRLPLKDSWVRILYPLIATYYLFKYRKQYTTIHSHGVWDFFGVFTLASKIMHKNFILHTTLLGSDDPLSLRRTYRYMRIRERWLFTHSYYIAISTPILKAFRKTTIPLSNVKYIPNGIEVATSPAFSSEAEQAEFLRDEGIDEYEKRAIFVGAVTERKRVHVLIEAWKIVQADHPNAVLIILGPTKFPGTGPARSEYLSSLVRDVEQHALNVTFKGERTDVEKFLCCCDVFLFASRNEGFGNAIAEAMAAGLPVVLSPMDGIADDFIRGGKEGRIATTAAEFASWCSYFFRNRDEARLAGQHAQETCRQLFNLDNVCDSYIDLYRDRRNERGT